MTGGSKPWRRAFISTCALAFAAPAWPAADASSESGPDRGSTTSPTTIITLPDLLPTTSTSTTTTSTTTSTTTTSTTTSTTTTTVPPACDGTRNRGRTDVGITGRQITLGAVTVDTGIAASLLGGETVALRAVVDRVNASGGVCGKELVLDIRDSGWEPTAGYEAIQELSARVFALVVNPDSNGLRLASEDGFLEAEGLPVIGTDGLLGNQFSDPYIWPVGPSMTTVGHVVADAQYESGLRNPAVVFENLFGFNRDLADAYHDQWERRAGSGIPGHSGNDGCVQRFCGLPPGWQAGPESTRLREACRQDPPCDAMAIAGLPSTTVNWLTHGGSGIVEMTDGAVAVPPLLFHQDFAQSCKDECDRLRMWTAFLPPIHPFADDPAVERYVADLRGVSPDVDVENQSTQAAYVGAELAVHALRHAAARPGGLTRENVVAVLDATAGWDVGLTVAPLSWSPGDHAAAATLHAFDIRWSPTTATTDFRYVDGSARASPG